MASQTPPVPSLHKPRSFSRPIPTTPTPDPIDTVNSQPRLPTLPVVTNNNIPTITTQHGDLQSPPAIAGADYFASSSPGSSRPGTSSGSPSSQPITPPTPQPQARSQSMLTPTLPGNAEKEGQKKRKSWFGRSKDKDANRGPDAWVVGHDERVAYPLNGLVAGEQVPELWDPRGDCLVYLFPRNSGKGPSFRVDSSIFASSPILTKKAFGTLYTDQTSPSSIQTPPATPQPRRGASNQTQDSANSWSSRSTGSSSEGPQREVHLYLDIALGDAPSASSANKKKSKGTLPESTETLVVLRNFFAFLEGQSLIATEKRSSLFSLFIELSKLLKVFGFSNMDASTYGEVATHSFDMYIEELGLADVRTSREKTIEGIVLAERMRSVTLYNEAFTHCVGKHDEITKLGSTKFQLLTPITVNRLGRAAIDLDRRTASVRQILEDFDFPSIFSGLMGSKTADERHEVDFDAWRDSFFSTRKFLMAYYKRRFGSWPPRASSKKNTLQTSGLNRLVLRELYHDLSAMYDLIVDRQNLTNRTADGVLIDERDADAPAVRAMRHILSEYDRSSPPVKPPVPFDLPTRPSLKSTRPDFGSGDKTKHAKALHKKIKDDEINQILTASYNPDVQASPFVDAFRAFERKAAHRCNISQICDLRMGQWMFMYAVLQALPLLVIDAPGIKHSQGVEYFLCEPPRSGVPWANPDMPRHQKNWYGIAGGGGVVSLPSDVIEHSTDAVYRRSHCWTSAQKWTESNPILAHAMNEQVNMNGNANANGVPSGGGGFHAPLTPPMAPAFNNAQQRPSSAHAGASAAGSSSMLGVRGPAWQAQRESVLMLGLEALPLPQNVSPDGIAPGIASTYSSSSLGGRPMSAPGHPNSAGGGGYGGGVYGGGNTPSQSTTGLGISPGAAGGGGGLSPGGPNSATFDAILGQSQSKPKKEKRKSTFGLI